MHEKNTEEFLTKLAPRKASAELRMKVQSLTAPAPTQHRSFWQKNKALASIAAAAAAIVIATIQFLPSAPQVAVNDGISVFEPQATSTVLLAYDTESVEMDNESMQKYSCDLVDYIVWVDSASGDQVILTQPRSDTIYISDPVI